jgi:hypothetical protein
MTDGRSAVGRFKYVVRVGVDFLGNAAIEDIVPGMF